MTDENHNNTLQLHEDTEQAHHQLIGSSENKGERTNSLEKPIKSNQQRQSELKEEFNHQQPRNLPTKCHLTTTENPDPSLSKRFDHNPNSLLQQPQPQFPTIKLSGEARRIHRPPTKVLTNTQSLLPNTLSRDDFKTKSAKGKGQALALRNTQSSRLPSKEPKQESKEQKARQFEPLPNSISRKIAEDIKRVKGKGRKRTSRFTCSSKKNKLPSQKMPPQGQSLSTIAAAVNKQFYEQDFDVREIIGKKKIKGKPFYKIHWEGYSIAESTWEPLSNLATCMGLVQEYELRLQAKPTPSSLTPQPGGFDAGASKYPPQAAMLQQKRGNKKPCAFARTKRPFFKDKANPYSKSGFIYDNEGKFEVFDRHSSDPFRAKQVSKRAPKAKDYSGAGLFPRQGANFTHKNKPKSQLPSPPLAPTPRENHNKTLRSAYTTTAASEIFEEANSNSTSKNIIKISNPNYVNDSEGGACEKETHDEFSPLPGNQAGLSLLESSKYSSNTNFRCNRRVNAAHFEGNNAPIGNTARLDCRPSTIKAPNHSEEGQIELHRPQNPSKAVSTSNSKNPPSFPDPDPQLLLQAAKDDKLPNLLSSLLQGDSLTPLNPNSERAPSTAPEDKLPQLLLLLQRLQEHHDYCPQKREYLALLSNPAVRATLGRVTKIKLIKCGRNIKKNLLRQLEEPSFVFPKVVNSRGVELNRRSKVEELESVNSEFAGCIALEMFVLAQSDRSSGVEDIYVSTELMKLFYPLMLVDFYEKSVKFRDEGGK